MTNAVPCATYRLQLTQRFGFREAAALVPYLKSLGVSHLYASPFLAARPGSTHGYDIVDHNRLSEELGGEAGFEALSAALKDADIGLILDFVPNHMGVGYSDNAWWLDVLEWGQKSPHAPSFDIDWQGLPYRHKPGVLLPILGRPYGEALQNGDIALRFDETAGSFAAWYFEHKLPINPQRYAEIVRTIVAAAGADTGEGRRLLAVVEPYRERQAPSCRDTPALKAALAQADGAAFIARGLAAYDARTESGRAMLHRLLERQAYHLAFWRVAFSAINYRRFFDINDLAGVRPEHPATFAAMHRLVARLIADGALQGLRLDHVDGLRDPAQYVRRLRELVRRVRPQTRADGFYVVVEKILGPHESLPPLGDIDGTTGYERLNVISRGLLDGEGVGALDRIWREFSDDNRRFDDIAREAKARVLDTMLASEFTVLARALGRIAAGHVSTRDYTVGRLQAALRSYVLEFPVYRTYVTATRTAEADRKLIDAAIARTRASWGGPDPGIFEFLHGCVTGDLARGRGYSAPRIRTFATKLQQFTGPLMAKSLEDTAFYRYHRLIALNEVGGEPSAGALTPEEFHAEQTRLLREQRDGLVATATHDTKRGEDARMRILALAEIPDDWREAVTGWASLNARFTHQVNGGRWPSAAHEYMLYQTLIGAWPGQLPDAGFVERVQAFALKAVREGKEQTSWTNPNEAYEQAVAQFVASILDPAQSADFIASLSKLAGRTALLGALNSLSQTALKLTLPGVPDIFQGTELWDLSMVDPDNRRPVDFATRRSLLADRADWAGCARDWRDGRIKFALIRTLLDFRRRHAALFREGSYTGVPLDPGPASGMAFARKFRGDRLLVVVGHHFAAATGGGRRWPDSFEIAFRERLDGYRDVLRDRPVGGRTVRLDDLPVGVYWRGRSI
ncbi:MAG: malto-oligosyltrehalose synthase [Xanthobacteraceae bacterium]|uniref:malto-oligosyltrehalose synthase n=1 Tax=Pseudolabrys sp. TaxID=1960880 RepID=UPI003D116253